MAAFSEYIQCWPEGIANVASFSEGAFVAAKGDRRTRHLHAMLGAMVYVHS